MPRFNWDKTCKYLNLPANDIKLYPRSSTLRCCWFRRSSSNWYPTTKISFELCIIHIDDSSIQCLQYILLVIPEILSSIQNAERNPNLPSHSSHPELSELHLQMHKLQNQNLLICPRLGPSQF